MRLARLGRLGQGQLVPGLVRLERLVVQQGKQAVVHFERHRQERLEGRPRVLGRGGKERSLCERLAQQNREGASEPCEPLLELPVAVAQLRCAWGGADASPSWAARCACNGSQSHWGHARV